MRLPVDDRWHEADALFRAALELPASQRASFLASECSDRPEVRREVESLLEAAQRGGEWIDRSGLIVREAAGVLLLEDCPHGEETIGAHDADEPPGRKIGRYRVIEKLARGGMGTVYLAERADGAFEQQVALKLLRRGLDTEDILERFRQERQILAGLEHPNIARLIDGGATDDGRPYLVMEYVEGASLTEYCDRERLDIAARLNLFAMVCGAVHYAHRRRVIHRDLKPSNILVNESGRVKLVDFGIAKLMTDDPATVRTSTGMLLLTPEYGSPEQVRGEAVSAASDIYQLGLLLHELLTGKPVHRFSTRSPSEIERVVCREPVEAPSSSVISADEQIERARSTEPGQLQHRLRGDLDTIVLKALRKEPEQRYESAAEMAQDVDKHLKGLRITARPPSPVHRLRMFSRRRGGRVLMAAGTAIVLLAFAFLPRLRSTTTSNTIGGSVAVLPFRTGGADPSLSYLHEGMMDLLAAELTGEGGPRAIAPATVLASWRETVADVGQDLSQPEALAVAHALGAERMLTGEVVGTPGRIIVNASLLEVPGGRIEGSATVEGPIDSLPSLVDRLTGHLLLLGAGEAVNPRGMFAGVPLPAVRAYLEGESAYRMARHDEAYRSFIRAVEIDSAFAVAAVRAYRAAWLSGRPGDRRLLDLAWRGRASLDELDRAYVTVYLGPRYPEPSSQTERLAQRHRLVELAPDRVDSQYMLGDRLYHWGPLIGIADSKQRALRRFRQALALDSAHTPIYRHLVPLLYSMGEFESATRLAQAYLRRQPSGGISQYVTWRMASANRDSLLLERVRNGMDTLPDIELLNIFRTALADAVELEDAERALTILRLRALSPGVEGRVLREHFVYEMLRGRPTTAVRAAARLGEAQSMSEDYPRLEYRSALVNASLFGSGDANAGLRAREALSASVLGPNNSINPDARVGDVCTVLHSAAWDGGIRDVRGALEVLRGFDRSAQPKNTGLVCALLVRAVVATLERWPDAAEALVSLDSVLATGPQMLVPDVSAPANLAAARLHEMQGDPEAALAAVRRRIYAFDSTDFLLAASLREEGRLAALIGDLSGAEQAYQYYLALRDEPEPELRPQVDSVRAELSAVRARQQ